MKKSIFIIILYSQTILLFSQKYDFLWLSGHKFNSTNFQGSIINFDNDPLIVDSFPLYNNFISTNSTMSDYNGNLVFYTNGKEIYRSDGQIMENGDHLNPGWIYNLDPNNGYGGTDGAFSLPVPNSSNKYYLIHSTMDTSSVLGGYYHWLRYSLIDATLNNGFGKVLVKNNTIITCDCSISAATKHSNGIDWWILTRSGWKDEYIRILITNNGAESIDSQYITGIDTISGGWYGGESVFSPNGLKFAIFDGVQGIRVFDFDRCTGILSNPHVIRYPKRIDWGGGLAFSSNSQYLYATSNKYIFQYDTEVIGFENYEDTVAIYDGFTDPNFTHFFTMQLGPDNKLYISTPGSNHLHVIISPDSAGVACNVQQHSIELHSLNLGTIPHNPNYRLGPSSTPCDTISTTITPQVYQAYTLYPNPVQDRLVLRFAQALPGAGEWVLYNATGQAVRRMSLAQGAQEVEMAVGDLAEGIYFSKIRVEGKEMGDKIVKREE